MVERLEEMKCSALMAVMLADLSRLGMTAADAGSIMSRMILERILGEPLRLYFTAVSVNLCQSHLISSFILQKQLSNATVYKVHKSIQYNTYRPS